jgi:hypothetical protein
MRKFSICFATLVCAFLGCETANYAPPVTPAMARSNTHGRWQVETEKFERGRNLFVHRCIECHTLPALWHYTPKDWTEIVNSMSHRASLKPEDRDAVIAYILAVRREM